MNHTNVLTKQRRIGPGTFWAVTLWSMEALVHGIFGPGTFCAGIFWAGTFWAGTLWAGSLCHGRNRWTKTFFKAISSNAYKY